MLSTVPFWLKHAEMKDNICEDRYKVHRYWPLEAAKFLWNSKGTVSLYSQTLCNVQYIISSYFWQLWCSLEIEKLIRPSSYFMDNSADISSCWGSMVLITLSRSQLPQGHMTEGYITTPSQPSLPLCKVILLFAANSVFFCTSDKFGIADQLSLSL